MSLSTTVILQGRAQRITVREGTAKDSGKPYRIVSAIVVGPLTMGEVTLPDSIVVEEGHDVTLLCEVSTYRDDDQLRALQLINSTPPKG